MLEKDDKVTLGIFMIWFFGTGLNEANITSGPFAKSARTFISCPEFHSFLKNI